MTWSRTLRIITGTGSLFPLETKLRSNSRRTVLCQGFQKLAIVNAEGEMVHGDARSDVGNSKPMDTYKKWLDLNKAK